MTEITKRNFQTLEMAFRAGRVCIMECFDRKAEDKAIIICAMNSDSEGVELVPFAVLVDADKDNPFERFLPPEGFTA
jgi:hypothetical protein